MTEDEKRSLIVPEEADAETEATLASELGGYQALVLFAVIIGFALFIFAFPTPFNPYVQPADERTLLETLEELDPTEETVSAVADEPTVEATTEPTDEPTVEPTTEPEPTDEPTVEPTTEPEPTEAMETEGVEDTEGIALLVANADPDNGEQLFNAPLETSAGVWMCSSCHSIDASLTRQVGPGLYGLYERQERLEATDDPTLAAYTVHSIQNPGAYLVPADPPYPENLMPPNYSEVLSEAELYDLAAYILTLGNPDS